jgi:hypothetical protein
MKEVTEPVQVDYWEHAVPFASCIRLESNVHGIEILLEQWIVFGRRRQCHKSVVDRDIGVYHLWLNLNIYLEGTRSRGWLFGQL